MNKSFWAILVLVIIIVIGGAFWYMQSASKGSMATDMQDMQGMDMSSTTAAANLGTYSYECDEHVTFSMTPASDMSSILITPLNPNGFPATTTLLQASSTSGVRYEANGTVFTGVGESVTFTNNGSTLNCSPVSSQDNAPFNFGE